MLLIVGIISLATNVIAENITPSEIFKKVKTTYESIQTYKSKGIIKSDIDSNEAKVYIETSFSIQLKKPNLYLISWTQTSIPKNIMSQNGVVWSDGTQPYLYIGTMNAYSRMGSDEIALSGATGISSGAALTIPSLFLSVFKESPPFSDLKAPKIEKTEKVGEEDCYLISGESTTSKKEVFWISKSRYLILKYYCSFEPPEGCAEMSDKELEVNDENKKKMREILNSSNDFQKKNQLKGSSTELHAEISFPEIKTKDFQFALPKSTTFKKSLFDVVLGKSKKDF